MRHLNITEISFEYGKKAENLIIKKVIVRNEKCILPNKSTLNDDG